jgi:hypothetical protein
MKNLITFVVLCCAISISSSYARDIYVNPQAGSDSADGLCAAVGDKSGPVKTIDRAMALAKAGDTVFLGGFTFKGKGEYVLVDKSGEPGKPIIIDGQGATIDGAIPIDPNEWVQAGPGLYKTEAIYKKWMKIFKGNDAWLCRFFFVFDGKFNRMNISCKAPAFPYKDPNALEPGEWSFQAKDTCFYIKTDPSKKLADCNVAVPNLVSGVQIYGSISHIVFRNIKATHVDNDGFALTTVDPNASISDIVYENICSMECGDDGFSAHGNCDVKVNGFYAENCSTGIASQGNSTNSRIVTKNIHGVDIYFGSGRHVITDSFLDCSGHLAPIIATVWPNEYGYKECSLTLNNVFIKGNKTGSHTIKIDGKGAIIDCNHVSVYGLAFVASGPSSLKLHNCLIGGGSTSSISLDPDAKLDADTNIYDIDFIRVGRNTYHAGEFAMYKKAAGCDDFSKMMAIEYKQMHQNKKQVGADVARIPGLNLK